MIISITPYAESHADSLSRFLLIDQKLCKTMGSGFDGTPADYHRVNTEWEKDKNTRFFTIFLSGEPVGNICLSHINEDEQTSRIGYWIGSEHWNKGYMTEAFRLVLEKAEEMGIREVSSTIEDGNAASRRLWEKYGPVKEMISSGKMRYSINIAERPAVQLQDEDMP